MRALFLFGTLTVALGAFAGDLLVVVYTTDAKVVEYTCANGVQNPYASGSVVMRTDNRPGRASWHAIGGVPPYKVIGYESSGGLVVVTMMDAAGSVASGVGVIGKQVQEVVANCKCWRGDELVPISQPAKKQAASYCATAERGTHRASPRTERGARTNAHVSDRGTRTTSTSSRVFTSAPEWPAPAGASRPGTIRTTDR